MICGLRHSFRHGRSPRNTDSPSILAFQRAPVFKYSRTAKLLVIESLRCSSQTNMSDIVYWTANCPKIPISPVLASVLCPLGVSGLCLGLPEHLRLGLPEHPPASLLWGFLYGTPVFFFVRWVSFRSFFLRLWILYKKNPMPPLYTRHERVS